MAYVGNHGFDEGYQVDLESAGDWLRVYEYCRLYRGWYQRRSQYRHHRVDTLAVRDHECGELDGDEGD